MDQKLIKMVTALFPDAMPDRDFAIEILADGTAIITQWNELKLGKNPGIKKIIIAADRQVAGVLNALQDRLGPCHIGGNKRSELFKNIGQYKFS